MPLKLVSASAAMAAVLTLSASAQEAAVPAPPVAAIKPFEVKAPHGATRTDNYYWLREKENPEVIAYLEAENAYADALLAPLKDQADAIYKELEARFAVADQEVPYRMDGYLYQSRYAEGADYPQIVRRKSADAPEEIVLDVPELAKAHEQYFLRGWEVSPDGAKIAFAVDFTGARVNEIFVRDIATGEVVSTGIKDAAGDMVWSPDGTQLIYATVDETVRSDKIKRHVLGTDAAADPVLMTEPDTTLSLNVGASRDEQFAIITVYHSQRTEIRTLSLTDPAAEIQTLVPRTRNVVATADHFDGGFYILTNLDAPDYRIMRAEDGATAIEQWTEVVPEVSGRYISNFAIFRDYIAIEEIHGATQTVRAIGRKDGAKFQLDALEELGVTGLGRNEDPETGTLRLSFEGMVTPEIVYDVDVKTGAKTELKKDPAWAWFDPSKYETMRVMAPAADGNIVTVTVVKLKSVTGPAPTLVYAYGSYGNSTLPGFYQSSMTLVDRGMVFAIAHVRGGRDMGQAWYEQGRMQFKMNTFTDFIAATEALIKDGIAKPGRVYARGGSAGGLLMGVITNLRPDLYDGVIAEVPFVDVLTTMLDETIPLTTFEWEEWGDPRKPEDYAWMAAYSPYDNVTAKAYPPLYVATGLNDTQVAYFEPAKWVAKLRAMKTDTNPLIFRTNMGAGHGGNSGRLGVLEDRAKMWAWLLDRAGKP
jgi:oligopeptidase B